MKCKALISTLGIVAVAGVLTYLLVQVAGFKKETVALRASLAAAMNRPAPALPAAHPRPPQEPIELADVMTKLQRHANKLYFAGKLENWKLADFYIEEIEETVKAIAKKDIMEGPINISGLMSGLILPEIEELERVASQSDVPGFEKHYKALVTACNACHVAANKPYIVIDQPRTPVFDNQHYEPLIPASAPVVGHGDAKAPAPDAAPNGERQKP
ncbi:MAG TPA: hypothetical protein VGK40_09860 [Verrucomicrobiae bacterium]